MLRIPALATLRTVREKDGLPALVTLRKIREDAGYTSVSLAAAMAARGTKVDPDYILQVELGYKNPGWAVRKTWAKVLNLQPGDIHTATELRKYVAADEGFQEAA